jgi:hypothetical protein
VVGEFAIWQMLYSARPAFTSFLQFQSKVRADHAKRALRCAERNSQNYIVGRKSRQAALLMHDYLLTRRE